MPKCSDVARCSNVALTFRRLFESRRPESPRRSGRAVSRPGRQDLLRAAQLRDKILLKRRRRAGRIISAETFEPDAPRLRRSSMKRTQVGTYPLTCQILLRAGQHTDVQDGSKVRMLRCDGNWHLGVVHVVHVRGRMVAASDPVVKIEFRKGDVLFFSQGGLFDEIMGM